MSIGFRPDFDRIRPDFVQATPAMDAVASTAEAVPPPKFLSGSKVKVGKQRGEEPWWHEPLLKASTVRATFPERTYIMGTTASSGGSRLLVECGSKKCADHERLCGHILEQIEAALKAKQVFTKLDCRILRDKLASTWR